MSQPTKTNQAQLNPNQLDLKLLDSRNKINQIDQENVLGSIEALADQVKHAWDDAKDLKFKSDISAKKIKNIVVAGMGGSGLGPDIAKHLFKDKLTIPLEVFNSYSLPAYANQNSLVILSSYSGNTEEVLACAQQVLDTKAMVLVITTGGKLLELAKKYSWPTYQIDPKYNPSNQPRMAIGYAIMGLMSLLNQAQVLKIKKQAISQAITSILAIDEACRVEVKAQVNPAKTLAFSLVDRRPILVGAQFLAGALHTATNQFNENAKTFADYKLLPEINHHLLEGLQFPTSNQLDHLFLLFNSKLYHPRIQKRVTLTQQAIEEQEIQTLAINLVSETKLSQIFELITLMVYANFYLAMLYQVNPAETPVVNWLKKQLAT